MLGLGTGLVFSLIGQRNALIVQIQASRQAAEANLQSGQELEAWLNSLRAGKSLKDWPGYLSLFKPDANLKIQVTKTLHKVVYGVRERNRLGKHQGRVIGLGISPDGSRIASVDDAGIICLWDRSGKLLNDDCFQGPLGRVLSASFNPDVSLLATMTASVDSNGSIQGNNSIVTLALSDLETQQQVKLNQEPHKGWTWEVVFSQDGEQLATWE
ncbi:MAG: WD40 repeat domain-containing protein [Moorea sp. SIOASIH]|uniref:WD40 repeat domain-containing protein n=1 Tax=Moorena sp. SIOASIH TaxID=2607817 RepID=UPI0013B9A053|nr:WD40 repeat domain-containing protein [Moorena sp. SIOASIH]NEO40294.1 WD40 repeat domain-containing protein [Moorena sp. SIOASIH]